MPLFIVAPRAVFDKRGEFARILPVRDEQQVVEQRGPAPSIRAIEELEHSGSGLLAQGIAIEADVEAQLARALAAPHRFAAPHPQEALAVEPAGELE